ncbi:uncharacterized protein BDV17DRAFT_288405 [Aspergillus undulatus]|uniref:uncharacterized protein n=1 Tax=Aspergillus undulatus TaxID=1810928 RepID=UPI003CCCEB06
MEHAVKEKEPKKPVFAFQSKDEVSFRIFGHPVVPSSRSEPHLPPQQMLPPSPISPPGSRDGQPDTALMRPHLKFVLEEFLAEHRANMALCMTTRDCTDPQHKPGMLLLVPLIVLLTHMAAAFDQVLQGGDTSQPQPPPTCNPLSPTEHRKEQINQANTLRAELAKLGALIQEFDRRYCSLENVPFGEDTFLLLSPLFANLQWKTHTKFDAVRSWVSRL